MLTAIWDWRRGHTAPSWRFHVGLVLVGWGIFNLVEGLVDHHLLRIQHVRDDLGGPLSWDLGFLAFGVLLVVGGWALYRSSPPAQMDLVVGVTACSAEKSNSGRCKPIDYEVVE